LGWVFNEGKWGEGGWSGGGGVGGVGNPPPPAERHNAALMRALLIEMYGPRLTAFQCYTILVLSWQKGTSDVHQGIYSVIRKTIYETAETRNLGHVTTGLAPDFPL